MQSEIFSNLAVSYAALYHAGHDLAHLEISGAKLKQALELNPDSSTASYNYACYWSLKGDSEQAGKYLRIAFEKATPEEARETKKLYAEDADLANFRKSPQAQTFEAEILKQRK